MANPLAAIGGGGGSQKVKFGDAGPATSETGPFNAGSTINFTPPRSLQQQGNNQVLKWGVLAAAGLAAVWMIRG